MFVSQFLAHAFSYLFWLGECFYGQPSATLFKDQLFVAVNQRHSTIGLLYRGIFDSKRMEGRPPLRYWNTTYSLKPSSLAKLDIRGDQLLLRQTGGGYFIFPLVDLQLLEWTDFGEQLCKLRGYSNQGEFADCFSGGSGTRVLFPTHHDPDAPLPPEKGFGGGRIEDPAEVYAENAHYDVQIAGPKTVRLFHTHKNILFVSIEPDCLNNWYLDKTGKVAENLPKPPDRQLQTGKLPDDFTERFTAYTSGGSDYFVTTTGKIYMSVSKGKTEVEVTSVWNEAKRKVVGVVQDLASGAVYGWGFDGVPGSADRFYVKFTPKPVAKPYKLTVPLWNDRADAYLESYECARAFRLATEKK